MIIDAHAHLTTSPSVMCFDDSLEGCISHFDKTGCDYVVQVLSTAIRGKIDDDYINKSIIFYEKSGGRIFSYFYYHPKKSKICLEYIDKYHSHPAFVGIKIHPSDNLVYADDEFYRAVFEKAKELGLPIMTHSWALTSNPKQKYAVPERFEKFIKEYPEVTFIMGHSGGRTSGIKEAVRMGRQYKNMYFDIAGDIYNRKLVEYITKNVGADKLLLGSDIAWFDILFQIGMILGADIKTEEKALIMGGNAAKVFGIGK